MDELEEAALLAAPVIVEELVTSDSNKNVEFKNTDNSRSDVELCSSFASPLNILLFGLLCMVIVFGVLSLFHINFLNAVLNPHSQPSRTITNFIRSLKN